MERCKSKGGKKIEEVVGRWNGKGERKVGEVQILKKINVKNNYRKIKKKKKKTINNKQTNVEAFQALRFYFFFPLSWKGSHKTLKLNWKGFGLGLIVELNK